MSTKDDGRVQFEHLYAHAQRTFVSHQAVAQVGQININRPLFAGAPIMGMQILPETALMSPVRSDAIVEGVAQGQATVEVRQAGVLVYTTLVPEGQSSLSGIPLLNSKTNLNVTVREASGAEQHF